MAPQPPNYRRVSYVIPLPIEQPPRLALPPLGAPRNGSIRPLLVPAPISTPTPHSAQPQSHYTDPKAHRRHRLGVSSLALDISTQLSGKNAPEGILYSGARDGQIIAWDLGLKAKKRQNRYGYISRLRKGRWEVLTGWEDDMDEEDEAEEEVIRSDGDVLGDVVDSSGRERRKSEALTETIPYEESWELDIDAGASPPSAFRQCIQTHTDWVNDILLCNLNQTVVSASSDGSIRAWSPHLSTVTEPALVGTHDDYVRCLTASRHQNWIASGSFDRTIRLWDISRTATPLASTATVTTSGTAALSTLSLPTPSQKSSVYALATDQLGSVIASGSPERVVRMWDPRTGKRTGKLVGHTDIIRAVVLSADGRYLLTGSADASIKLWSLVAQRCLHTFAHHTDSVWALSSHHPSLEIFYSGDRSGIVSRVDMEGCNTVDEGECLVISNAARTSEVDNPERNGSPGESFRLQDVAGVNKILALDDRLVWTATGSSSITRWKAPPRRALRISSHSMPASPENTTFSSNAMSASRRTSASSDVHSTKRGFSQNIDGTHNELPRSPVSPGTSRSTRHFSTSTNFSLSGEAMIQDDTTLFGIPFQSLVRLVSPNDPYALGSPISGSGGYARRVRKHTSKDTEIATLYSAASVKSIPAARHSVVPLTPAPTMRSPFRQDTGGTLSPRLITFPSDTQDETRVLSPRAQYEERDLAATAWPLEKFPDDTIQGENGVVRAVPLNDRMHVLTVNTAGYVGIWDVARCRCIGWFDRADIFKEMGCNHGTDGSSVSESNFRSPRELLETVRERIEGECVIAPWATADTRVGNLTVHLSEKCFETEIYADEAGYGNERLYDTDQRLNIAKWILSNLFEGFVREEVKLRRPHTHQHGSSRAAHDSRLSISSFSAIDGRKRSSSAVSINSTKSSASRAVVSSIISSPSMSPAIVPDMALANARRPSVSLSAPLIPIVAANETQSPPVLQAAGNAIATGGVPTPRPRREASETPAVARSAPGKDTSDYFSAKAKRLSSTSTSDDFSGWGGPVSSKDKEGGSLPQTPGTPSGGGFMGRLRNFGKSSKRPLSGEMASAPGGTSVSRANEGQDDRKEDQHSTREPETEQSRFLTAQTFHPPSVADAPPSHLPPDTEIILAEEAQSGWTNVYRGTVGSTAADVAVLEKVMPLWLMQYLLCNKVPLVPNVKVSFGVAPLPAPGEENVSPTRLTANRYLRVRKIIGYVQDKIDKPASRSGSRSGSISGATPRSSSEAIASRSASQSSSTHSHRDVDKKQPRAEDVYELLCNDVVLSLDMTLASIRHYVWRNSAEVVLFYRRK